MKMTIESTDRIIEINGHQARVWQGKTENGVGVLCVISRVAVRADADASQFESELKEQHVPASRDAIMAFDARLVL